MCPRAAGRIDLFGLADAAPLVVVGTTDDRRHVSVLHVLKGARPARGLRLVLPGGTAPDRSMTPEEQLAVLMTILLPAVAEALVYTNWPTRHGP